VKPTPLLGVVALLAFTSSSIATADDGSGPLGVTAVAPPGSVVDRVGAVFRDGTGGGHFCTASVVPSPRHDLLVTAAHCLDGGGGLVFAPAYRDGAAPYGVWKVTGTFLADGWDEDTDVGFARVEKLGGVGVQDLVGANPFVTHRATGATAVTVVGYPRSREVPLACTNRPTSHSPTQQRIECPGLSGGTSGSPWVDGDGQVVGVLGGHEAGGATDDVSYSAVLGDEVAALYRRAAGS
jgi:V8-like Glu-specific endopeptidase